MLGKKISYEINGNEIAIQFEGGKGYIRVIKEDIIQVFCPLSGGEYPSKAVEGEKKRDTCMEIKEQDSKLIIQTETLQICVEDEFYVDFYDRNQTPLCMDYRGKRVLQQRISEKMKKLMQGEGHNPFGLLKEAYPVQVVKVLDGDEKFYGLGDKMGSLNKRGYDYENWNTSNPQAQTEAFKALYKSVPFFVTLKENSVYGLFYDNTYKAYIDFGKENKDYFFYAAEGGNLNYYFIGGREMTDVVKNYTYLTGRAPKPQLWTLGYHQSRFGYESAEDIQNLMENFKKYEIPCDAIHLDIDYMDGFRVFTWSEENFGKQEELTAKMEREGFKAVAILDPGVKQETGYDIYEEGIAGDYFVKDADGRVYINTVWSGETVFPDFGRAEIRRWWGEKQKYLVQNGISGIWNDMNEPRSFRSDLPDDVVFYDEERKTDHAEMHNVYGHSMSKAAYEGIKDATGKRPFVITRACYAGTQKYSIVWTGDNQSLWMHLQMAIPQLLSLGMSGFAIAGTDVGGFGADCNAELLCRWVQLGAFSPFFRNHSSKGTLPQEPWRFDEKTLAINKKFIELRYRLLPYFYDLCHECEEEGLPIMRPLVLHYENDEATWNLNEEFLVGRNLLVALVVAQGEVKKIVYFPAGKWYDFETGEEYEGNQYHMVDAPLDKCPMFVREGAMIPTYEVKQHIKQTEYTKLIMRVYPGEGSYIHYQDNGIDFAYRNGEYNLYKFVHKDGKMPEYSMIHHQYTAYEEIVYEMIQP